MKCTNRITAGLSVLIVCLMLGGCSGRQEEPKNAYQIYDTSDAFHLTESTMAQSPALMAEDLCVGGTQNTVTDLVNAGHAQSAAVFAVDDGEITYAQNIYEKRYPASTTKIMTAYLAYKYGNPDDMITVSAEAVNTLDPTSSICGLKPGDQLTLDQVLHGLMLCSGNDAANVIAEHISGGTEAFAELMNTEAAALGATQSHFVNPHGLPDDNHYTTAYDLYLIFNAAIKDERFVDLISTKSYDVTYTGAGGEPITQTWSNTNGYLKGDYEMPENVTVIGGKTGTTSVAGSCLVLYSVNAENKPIISIVLKGNSKADLYGMMTEMLTNFSN